MLAPMADDTFGTTKKLLEQVLTKLGLDPAGARVRDEADLVAWGIWRGSAQLLLIAQTSDKGTWVRAVAPVVVCPTDHALRLSLFARLLELNGKAMRNAAFGVLNEKVVIVSERPAEGLDAAEVEQIVRHVGAAADHYDDVFEKEYGLPRASQA